MTTKEMIVDASLNRLLACDVHGASCPCPNFRLPATPVKASQKALASVPWIQSLSPARLTSLAE